MEDLAAEIVRRANRQGVSINSLCRSAGVSRRWFEYLKQRTPKAVKAYAKINQCLAEMEKLKSQDHANSNNTGETQRS